MNREAALVALALLIVASTAVAAVMVPGALADRSAEEDVQRSRLSLLETSIQPGAVSGETAELVIESRLRHRGGPADNVTIEVRAIDDQSGMVETTVRQDLGTIEGDREVPVVTNLSVAREGGYRIVTRLYEDERRIDQGATSVSGVGSLVPEYARTPVSFHRFERSGLPVIPYGVENASGDQVRIRASTYLTNTGDEPAGGLELTLMARQAESNIVADSATVAIDEVQPGRTITPGAALTVPDNYSYYLDAILRKDGVIVGTASAPATLDPSRTVPENQTREDVGLQAGDFERGGTPETEEFEPTRPEDEATPTSGGGGSGFGVTAALAALVAAALAAHRRNP